MIGRTWGGGLPPRPNEGKEPGPEPFMFDGAGGSTAEEPGPA